MIDSAPILKKQFPKTQDLIYGTEELLFEMKDIRYSVEETIISRLNKWIYYFNQNYTKFVCGYSLLALTLIEAAKNNQIFRTQTEYEFKTSLKFYDFISDSDIFFSLSTPESAKYLLKISLLFGKYSGMIIRSTRSSVKTLENGINENNLNKLFESLFVKYENPFILTNNLNKLNLAEIEALMHILQGNNIRNFNKLPFHVSRKESFHFLFKLPQTLTFKKDILAKGLICSKLSLCKSYNKILLHEFVLCSKVFEFKPYTFHDDIGFWQNVFELICNVQWNYSPLLMQEYIDFFEYKKYTENLNYSLKGRTVKSVTKAIVNWHEAADYAEKLKLIELEWNGSNLKEIKLEREGIEYVFNEITNGKELFSESKKMKHCVFSYIESCANGYTSIWSMKKKMDSIYTSYLTIEVRKNKVIQISGKRNRQVNHTELELIKKWAKEMNFDIDHELFHK